MVTTDFDASIASSSEFRQRWVVLQKLWASFFKV